MPFQQQTLPKVPSAYHAQVVDRLPLDLPLETAGQAIRDESYWKRRSQARWTNCDTLKHGGSYKQLFFERHLQDTLEECGALIKLASVIYSTLLAMESISCS